MAETDLTDILHEWPYEGGRVNVRLVPATDGRTVIQMRVDLGILQMELNGRPDGQRPNDHESWLSWYTTRLADADTPKDFRLNAEDCRRLREEAMQYYHRYIALFTLDEYEGVVRDTTHNLTIIELCRNFGESELERGAMEPLRPNTIMMRVRAQAAQAVLAGESRAALQIIDAGLDELREAMRQYGAVDEFDDAPEVNLLRAMRASIVPALPASQRHELMERLKAAIAAENYELAAILRDELRMMRD